MKWRKSYLLIIIAAVIVIAAVILARVFLYADRYSVLGFLVLGIGIGLLAWKAFSVRNDSKEMESLKKTIKELDRELAEKSQSRLNVVELNPILHVAVLNVDTSFVRPYVRENGRLTFNGALRADLRVEYGIRLEEVLFRYDEPSNTLTLANFHPGIISYSRKQLKWEFAKAYKSRTLLGMGIPDVSDKEAEKYTAETCEALREELEREIDTRKVSEFEWLSPLVTDQVMDVLRLMVGKENLNIAIAEHAGGEGYVGLPELKQIVSRPIPEIQ